MMFYRFRLHDVEYGTGLQTPSFRETSFPAYAASGGPIYSEADAQKILSAPDRIAGRKEFGAEWIKNQGNLGACNGFACASAVERSRVNRGLPRVKLSGFGFYAAINGGRDNGSMLEDGMKWMQQKGCPIELENERPEYRWNRIPQASKDAMSQYKAAGCYHIDSELELVSALAAGYVCVVAVHATDRWSNQDKDGVSYESNGVGNHSVMVDDAIVLPSGEFAFDMANSWSTRWGAQGRTYLTWKRHLRQTVENHYFFAIRTTSDGK